ncbi:MAG: VOC family protein [Beijerinckiaceae bacterium]|nr:VOC family protein [Beijerinckiaceae bacterium]
MYFHVMVGATDLEASKAFYDATFATLGITGKGKLRDTPLAYMYGEPETGLFFISKTQDGKPATYANGGTIMFKAPSEAAAKAWYETGLAHGGLPEDAPAPGALPGTVMSRLRDPTGNKIAVVAFV